jgi:hypothetical protein
MAKSLKGKSKKSKAKKQTITTLSYTEALQNSSGKLGAWNTSVKHSVHKSAKDLNKQKIKKLTKRLTIDPNMDYCEPYHFALSP